MHSPPMAGLSVAERPSHGLRWGRTRSRVLAGSREASRWPHEWGVYGVPTLCWTGSGSLLCTLPPHGMLWVTFGAEGYNTVLFSAV